MEHSTCAAPTAAAAAAADPLVSSSYYYYYHLCAHPCCIGAAVVATAAVSAAMGSFATAFFMRRRRSRLSRRRGRRGNDDDDDDGDDCGEFDDDEGAPRYYASRRVDDDEGELRLVAKPNSSSLCDDDNDDGDDDRPGDMLRASRLASSFSKAPSALTSSVMRQDYYCRSPSSTHSLTPLSRRRRRRRRTDCDGDGDGDGVSSLGEVSREISQMRTSQQDRMNSEKSGYDWLADDDDDDENDNDNEFCPASLSLRANGPTGPQNGLPTTTLTRRGSESDALASSTRSQPGRASTESYVTETELLFKGSASFARSVAASSPSLPDSLLLLRRTRAVSSLSNRLMAAPDERTCVEEATRLLVVMFGVERASFAMLTGKDHFLLQRVTAVPRGGTTGGGGGGGRDDGKGGASKTAGGSSKGAAQAPTTTRVDRSSFDLEFLSSDRDRPLAGTAAGACASTLREHYTPRTADSPFDTHRVFRRNGINTVLVSPILVNGNRCTGCIMLVRREEDGFDAAERALVGDIGLLLGANIYAKRLLMEAEGARRRSREMLHSFIPPKVLEKIECYWDENSDKFRKRGSANSSLSSSLGSVGSTGSAHSKPPALGEQRPRRSKESSTDKRHRHARTNSWFVAQSAWNDAEITPPSDPADSASPHSGLREKIRLIKDMNRPPSDVPGEQADVVVVHAAPGMSASCFSPAAHALYAESVGNVCIVFTDIVGFSRIAMDLRPSDVMDMLQDLFNRFDELCDVHGVLKLETIGDAYICCTNLMEDDDEDGEAGGVEDAAARALAMAKDMVAEATEVRIPRGRSSGATVEEEEEEEEETLRIRVGIHVGDVTCGVLGQRLPKFTTCGTAVNMAARMEQNSQPCRIRVTKDFHDAVGDAETRWFEKEVIPLKNMGSIETYLLDPMRPA